MAHLGARVSEVAKGVVLLQEVAQSRAVGPMEGAAAGGCAKGGGARCAPECGALGQPERQDDAKRGPLGCEAAKLIKGRKGPLGVDTLGLILKGVLRQAPVGEGEGAAWLLLASVGLFTRLKLLGLDGCDAGVDFAAWVPRWLGVRLEVVERKPGLKGFQKLPRPWGLERPFSWLNNARRLSKDYQFHLQSSQTLIFATMLRIIPRPLAPPSPPP
jgi:putative transposase